MRIPRKDNVVHYRLSIAIPCFNEGRRMNTDLFSEHIRLSDDCLFCFINDGSTDNTASILLDLEQRFPGKVKVLENHRNQGKAAAVRKGVNFLLTFNTSYICYWDADQSAPLKEVMRLYNIISANDQLSLVFGSRVALFGAHVKRSFLRYFAGRFFAGAVRYMLRLPIYDTQCGIKIFRCALAEWVFKKPFTYRWLFDVEIFNRVKHCYPNSELTDFMEEVPLREWHDVKGSKLRFIDCIQIPIMLLLLAIQMKFGKKADTALITSQVTVPTSLVNISSL